MRIWNVASLQLETLYEIGRACAHTHTVGDMLRVILSVLMGTFGATRGIGFAGDAEGRLQAVSSRGLSGDDDLSERALAQAYLLGGGGESWQATAGMEVCLPFRIDASTHGAVALGPRLTGALYTADDRTLLETIVANALPHLHEMKLLHALQLTADELRRKVQALAVANEIALGGAARPTARRLHRFLLEWIASALDAAEIALGLVAGGCWRVAARYAGRLDPATDPQTVEPESEVLVRLAAPEWSVDAGREMVVPVRYGAELIGAIWLRREPRARRFDGDDRALLEFLANQVAIVLENSRLVEGFLAQRQEQFRLRGMLEQYLAPTVAERLIAGSTRPALEGTRLPVSVLMVDMRGSTELINRVDPEVMVRLLNQYLGRMTDILFDHEGTIDKFEGDAVLGFFGAPEAHDDDPLRAVGAAAAMQRAFASLLAEWRRQYGLSEALGIGVGIATGEVVVGNIGSAKRLEHTVIGAAVNLAACLTARAPAGTILLDGPTGTP
ncbi:MAG: GAF domain-containing protein [Chloroflexi bacterium]|nr:GAF domain-containing protein [Chloroflexota bacterium]